MNRTTSSGGATGCADPTGARGAPRPALAEASELFVAGAAGPAVFQEHVVERAAAGLAFDEHREVERGLVLGAERQRSAGASNLVCGALDHPGSTEARGGCRAEARRRAPEEVARRGRASTGLQGGAAMAPGGCLLAAAIERESVAGGGARIGLGGSWRRARDPAVRAAVSPDRGGRVISRNRCVNSPSRSKEYGEVRSGHVPCSRRGFRTGSRQQGAALARRSRAEPEERDRGGPRGPRADGRPARGLRRRVGGARRHRRGGGGLDLLSGRGLRRDQGPRRRDHGAAAGARARTRDGRFRSSSCTARRRSVTSCASPRASSRRSSASRRSSGR